MNVFIVGEAFGRRKNMHVSKAPLVVIKLCENGLYHTTNLLYKLCRFVKRNSIELKRTIFNRFQKWNFKSGADPLIFSCRRMKPRKNKRNPILNSLHAKYSYEVNTSVSAASAATTTCRAQNNLWCFSDNLFAMIPARRAFRQSFPGRRWWYARY